MMIYIWFMIEEGGVLDYSGQFSNNWVASR